MKRSSGYFLLGLLSGAVALLIIERLRQERAEDAELLTKRMQAHLELLEARLEETIGSQQEPAEV
jgi:flagellar biosynthesis chaperone FliJ